MNETRRAHLPPNGAIAVIFMSQRRTTDDVGYQTAAVAMEKLAAGQPGYLGHVAVRDGTGLGMTVSYWQTQQDARQWRMQAEHAAVRELGRERWYDSYQLVIAQVVRGEEWPAMLESS